MIKRLLIAFLMISQLALAQDMKKISGEIRDNLGIQLPGATIVLKGTTNGTTANLNGLFELNNVKSSDVLVVSFIGLKTQELTVGDKTSFLVVLDDDASDLEEVVVIGYGSSKSKDLTSPIATVSGKELSAMNTTSPMSAVQGKVAGVNIVNSGAPGAGPKVTIRGVGSFENSNPLYVVDGMFVNDINFLSANDIETMSVLKDASAAAIYGVRAANGVVLITTKGGGKNRKLQVSYDGYYGVQSVTQRLDMANSAQYAQFMRDSGVQGYIKRVDAAIERFGGENGVPSVSTDWYKELIRNNAPIQNHNVSLMGGAEKSAYAFSVGYLGQDGIMDSDGEYNRINLRAKVDFDASSKLKIGFSTLLTQEDRMVDDDQAWFQAYISNPMFPVYDQSLADSESNPIKFGNPHNLGYDTYYSNPKAVAYYNKDNESANTRFMPNIYAELMPWERKDITFRSSLSMDFSYGASRHYLPAFKVGNIERKNNSLSKQTNWNYDYIWDNTITAKNSWYGHSLTSMVGFSVREENNRWLRGTAQEVVLPDYIGTGNKTTRTVEDGGQRLRGMSAFARFSYDYRHRYLLSVTMRADGSSKFQDKWGYFPSVGAGWVVSEESFAQSLRDWKFDFLKLRASWGMLGNAGVPDNDGYASISNGSLNDSGIFGGVLIPGMINNTRFSYLKWEEVHESNAGVDAKLFDYRLAVEVDYYNRDTKNAVVTPRAAFGNPEVKQNIAVIRNSGIETMINWSDKVGKAFHYSVGANITTINNKVKELDGNPYVELGSAEFPQRHVVGGETYSFYGWEVAGVYQNQKEIDESPIAKANGLKPGDFKFVDRNGDQIIDSRDRTTLGSPNPDFTYGLNFAVGYKGFTLAAAFQGVEGVTIFNRRRADINKHGSNNIDANLVESVWTGEGSTNSTPSAAGMFKPWNNGRLSNFFLEDGSYFRIQNVRLSYDLPKAVIQKLKMGSAQVYLNADRPHTFFSSNGFTPEVPGGIDQQVYPIPAIFSLGARISF